MATNSDDIERSSGKVLRLADELIMLDRSDAGTYASVRRKESQLHETREELKLAQLRMELCDVRKSEEDLKKRCEGLETQYKDTLRMLTILMPVAVDSLGGDKLCALFEAQGLANDSVFRVLFSDAVECQEARCGSDDGATSDHGPEAPEA
nr:hypothetical protein B0A51_11372 [Rachicladosporium sp. CCFEE 5018]